MRGYKGYNRCDEVRVASNMPTLPLGRNKTDFRASKGDGKSQNTDFSLELNHSVTTVSSLSTSTDIEEQDEDELIKKRCIDQVMDLKNKVHTAV